MIKILMMILCCLVIKGVSSINPKIDSNNETEPFIEISEVNNTDYNIDGNFKWEAGTRHVIECTILKEEHLKYIDPSGNIVEGGQISRISSQNYATKVDGSHVLSTLSLSFNPTTTEDTGTWQCNSINKSLNGSFTLCVIDRLRFLDKTSRSFARRGRSTSLKCKAIGEPEPMFEWYRNEELITDDFNAKYKISTKYSTNCLMSTLTITNITKEDKGLYVCKALQKAPTAGCSHNDFKDYTLKVKYAPTFETGNTYSHFYSIVGESENIRCVADGYPKPKYTWYRHINGSDSLDLLVYSSDLNITIGESSFGERYTCRAANCEGAASKTYVITKLLEPQSPDNIHFNTNGTFKTVTMNWIEEIKYPIRGVDIQYYNGICKADREDIWKSGKLINLDINDEQYNYNNSLTVALRFLGEDNLYCSRLRVTNKAGSSPWSKPIATYNMSSMELKTPPSDPKLYSVEYQEVIKGIIMIFNLNITILISYFISYFI